MFLFITSKFYCYLFLITPLLKTGKILQPFETFMFYAQIFEHRTEKPKKNNDKNLSFENIVQDIQLLDLYRGKYLSKLYFPLIIAQVQNNATKIMFQPTDIAKFFLKRIDINFFHNFLPKSLRAK